MLQETQGSGIAQRFRLDGRTALVTGASKGLGAAMAEAFAAQGARVILVARTRHELEEVASRIIESGGQAEVLGGNIDDRTPSCLPIRVFLHLLDGSLGNDEASSRIEIKKLIQVLLCHYVNGFGNVRSSVVDENVQLRELCNHLSDARRVSDIANLTSEGKRNIVRWFSKKVLACSSAFGAARQKVRNTHSARKPQKLPGI